MGRTEPTLSAIGVAPDSADGGGAENRAKTKTCRSHCRSCGRHFSGDSAFFAHRIGKPEERECAEVEEDKRFGSEWGECRIKDAGVHPAEIFFLAAARQRMQERFAA